MIKRQDEIQRRQPIIRACLLLLYARDAQTARHCVRVSRIAEKMAEELSLPASLRWRIRDAGLMHDLGKLTVRDEVLLKTDRLNSDEWEMMKTHPQAGARLLQLLPAMEELAAPVLQHHERWDGLGYPLGLEKEEICQEARILAVADAWDAMLAGRIYRPGIKPWQALEQIEAGSGSQFDPEIASRFAAMHRRLQEV